MTRDEIIRMAWDRRTSGDCFPCADRAFHPSGVDAGPHRRRVLLHLVDYQMNEQIVFATGYLLGLISGLLIALRKIK